MIDLYEFLRTESADGKSSDQVKQMLSNYRETKGDNIIFLQNNPSLGQPNIGYDTAHFVYLTLYPQDPSGSHVYNPDDIFVDLNTLTVRALTRDFLLADLDAAESQPLTISQRDEITALLNTYVLTWDGAYPEAWNNGTRTTNYQGWLLAVCLDDDSLYSFRSMGELDNLPPDFQDFVDSFLQITGTTW